VVEVLGDRRHGLLHVRPPSLDMLTATPLKKLPLLSTPLAKIEE